MTTPFQTIKNTPPVAAPQITMRDVEIMSRRIAVMTRQNGDLSSTLAHAEAINQQLVTEYQQLQAAHEALKKQVDDRTHKKDKKG